MSHPKDTNDWLSRSWGPHTARASSLFQSGKQTDSLSQLPSEGHDSDALAINKKRLSFSFFGQQPERAVRSNTEPEPPSPTPT